MFPLLPLDILFMIIINFIFEAGSLKNLTKYMGDSIAFWKDLMAHPNYDAWWKARDARNATKNLQPAMLWVGGLFDAEDAGVHGMPIKRQKKIIRVKRLIKLLKVPGTMGNGPINDGTKHGNIQFGSNTSEYYQQHFEIPFFNYFLKDKGDISQIAEANIFITGANEWKSFTKWPPENKEERDHVSATRR